MGLKFTASGTVVTERGESHKVVIEKAKKEVNQDIKCDYRIIDLRMQMEERLYEDGVKDEEEISWSMEGEKIEYGDF